MKTTKLLAVLGIATFAVGILGPTALAADATGKSTAKVEFIDGEKNLVDPNIPDQTDKEVKPYDPEKDKPIDNNPLTPDGKPNPDYNPETNIEVPTPITQDGTSIVYYPNFNFGIHTVSGLAQKYNAIFNKNDKWSDVENNNPVFKQNFLQINYAPNVINWKISAQLGKFTSGSESLNGATLKLTGNTHVQQFGDKDRVSVTQDISLADTATSPTTVAIFDGMTNADSRIASILFGTKVSEERDQGTEPSLFKQTGKHDDTIQYNNGVVLELPNSAGMEKDLTYTADLTWTLSSSLQP